jgi:hypothetical protein
LTDLASELNKLLDQYREKRVVVIGTTCTGKTTLLSQIPDAQDMDKLLFPKLSKAESEYVCSSPWTEEIGATMNKLAKSRIAVLPGKPVFGTVVLDCDLIINLSISDTLLKERCLLRKASFIDAKNMQQRIEKEIAASSLPKIDFPVG